MSFRAGGLRAGISRAQSCASALPGCVAGGCDRAALAALARASAASGRPPMGAAWGQTAEQRRRHQRGAAQAVRPERSLVGHARSMTGPTPAPVQLDDEGPAGAPGLARCAATGPGPELDQRAGSARRGANAAAGPRPAIDTARVGHGRDRVGVSHRRRRDLAYPAGLDVPYLSGSAPVAGTRRRSPTRTTTRTAESTSATFRAPQGWPPAPRPTGAFEGQPERGRVTAAGGRQRLGRGDLARPRCGLRAVPELPHPPRRGQLDDVDRHDCGDADHGGAWRQAGVRRWSVSSSAPVGGSYTLPGVDVVAATGDHGYPGAGVDN